MNLAKRIRIDTKLYFLRRQIRHLKMRKMFPDRFQSHDEISEGVIDLMITDIEKKIETYELEK